MEKIIKILSGYTIVFGIYMIVANFLFIGKEVRLTSERFFLTLLTILPIIILAILVLRYLKKKI